MNKTLKIILIAVAALQISILGSFAQTKSTKQPAAAKAKGEQKDEPKTIFSYKKELGLTDKQIESIKALYSKMQDTFNEKGKELSDLQNSLSTKINKKDNLKLIKADVDKVYNIKAQLFYLDIETARKIEETLSAEQWKKWLSIRTAEMEKQKEELEKAGKSAKP
jgi:Spy/CpxP family protein refolding chaperone